MDEQELVARWIQLSSFYPLAWFAQSLLWTPRDLTAPYDDIVQFAITDRYKYMLFMYTAMFKANQTGCTVFDPLFYSFPTVEGAYDDIENTFMVGDAIKVSPNLKSTNNFTDLT